MTETHRERVRFSRRVAGLRELLVAEGWTRTEWAGDRANAINAHNERGARDQRVTYPQ